MDPQILERIGNNDPNLITLNLGNNHIDTYWTRKHTGFLRNLKV